MAKVMKCREVGLDCDFVATGENEGEIMAKVAKTREGRSRHDRFARGRREGPGRHSRGLRAFRFPGLNPHPKFTHRRTFIARMGEAVIWCAALEFVPRAELASEIKT
jgi:hypothetical protein